MTVINLKNTWTPDTAAASLALISSLQDGGELILQHPTHDDMVELYQVAMSKAAAAGLLVQVRQTPDSYSLQLCAPDALARGTGAGGRRPGEVTQRIRDMKPGDRLVIDPSQIPSLQSVRNELSRLNSLGGGFRWMLTPQGNGPATILMADKRPGKPAEPPVLSAPKADDDESFF